MQLIDIKDKIPAGLFDILKNDVDRLRPCQEKAVSHGLLDGKNLLVCTPTASGKCMHYDSRVLLADGRLLRIGDLYALNHSSALYALSLDEKDLKIKRKKISNIYKIYHNKPLLRITTGLGNAIKVTPEHPFLIKNESGLEWIRADKLKREDFIVVPRLTETFPQGYKLDKKKTILSFSRGYVDKKELLECLIKKTKKSYVEVAALLGVSERDIYRWRKITAMPLDKLLMLSKITKEPIFSKVDYVSDINGISNLKLPLKITKGIARILGLIIGDGSIHYKRGAFVSFTNMNKGLRAEFRRLCKGEFNVISKLKISLGKSTQEVAYSKVFSELMMRLEIPSGKKSDKAIVPSFMFIQPKPVISSFLSALFDCDGSIYDKGIEYSTDSEKLIFGIQSLLLRFGIVSIIKKRFFKGKTRYRLFIYRRENIKIFHNRIGFKNNIKNKRLVQWLKNRNESTNIDVIPFINHDFKCLKKELNLNANNMPASFESYIYGWRKNISHFNLKRFVSKYVKDTKKPVSKQLGILAESHIYFDRIKGISYTKNVKYVYDITVPETNNLIAENIIVHNTLVAEVAALNCILEKKGKAIYIVPLKALASEKFKDFKKRYGGVCNVALSVGDFDSSDSYLGNYDLIVCTAEKLDSLARHRAPWLSAVKVLIIDEVHMLNDIGRGPTLEIMITMLRQMLDVQIIALSATIGNPSELASWLNANLIIDDWRPVELKKGIYMQGSVLFE